MSYEFTDDMTILEMMIMYEASQIRRRHSKNTESEDWPSDQEILNEAIENINSLPNVQLLEQMQFVINERIEQRVNREKARLSVQEG